MIQCPECRNMIPDDSAFCDQCGKELMWCPECKRPKRGTECPVCGSDLIPGRKYLASLAGGAAPERQEGLPPSAVSHPLDPTADAVPPLTKSGVPENSPIFGVHTRVAAASEGLVPSAAPFPASPFAALGANSANDSPGCPITITVERTGISSPSL